MNTINKKFPNDYSVEMAKIITAMSFTGKHNIVGSMSQKGLLYPSDVDMIETVKNKFRNIDECLNYLKTEFQKIIKNLMVMNTVIIGDIKAGMQNNEPVRWKPKDIFKGVKDGYKLENAFNEKSMFKMDVIAYIQNVFTEISIIYMFENNNKILNNYSQDPITNDIQEFEKDGNFYKIAKRIYSLKPNPKLKELFNSQVGAINQVIANIDTISYILENRGQIPFKKIDTELDGFITRLNLLDNARLIKKPDVNVLLKHAENVKNRIQLIKDLTKLRNILNTIVQIDAKEFLIKHKFIKI